MPISREELLGTQNAQSSQIKKTNTGMVGISREELLSGVGNKASNIFQDSTQERQSMIDSGQAVSTNRRFERTGENEPTFGGSIVRAPLKPFARVAENIRRGGSAIFAPEKTKEALGITDDMSRKEKKQLYFRSENRNAPYLGGVKPISKPLEAVGAIAEIGSYPLGGVEFAPATQLLKQGIKTGTAQLIKQGLKGVGRFAATEGVAGALGNVGAGLQEDEVTAGKIAGDAVVGFLAGAGLSTAGAGLLSNAGRFALKTQEVFTPNLLRNIYPEGSDAIIDVATQNIRKGWNDTFDATKPISRKNAELLKKGVDVGDVYTRYNIVPDIDPATGRLNVDSSISDMGEILDSYYTNIGEYLSRFDNKRVSMDQLEEQVIRDILNNKEYVSEGITQKVGKTVADKFADWRSTYGNSLTPSQINDIRRSMNRNWNEDATVRAGERSIGDLMRKTLDGVTGSDAIRKVHKEVGQLITARDFLDKNLRNQVLGGGRASTLIARILGTLIGSDSGVPVIGPLVGAIGGDAIVRMIRMNALGGPLERRIIQRLQAEKPLLDMLKEATRQLDNKAFLRKISLADQQFLPAPSGKPTGNFRPIRMGGDTVNNFEPAAQNALPRSNFAAEQRMANTMGLPAPSGARLGVSPNAIQIPPANSVPTGLFDEKQVARIQNNVPVDELTSSIKKAKASGQSFDEWEKNELDKNTSRMLVNKKVYRGTGKGIGNTTLVKGQYFANTKEFASNFGDVYEEIIPKNSKIFNLDAIKSGQGMIPNTMLVDPDALTKYLIDNGFDYTKNTNTRGVEYVKLNKQLNKLEDIARKSKTLSEFKKQVINNYDEFRDEIARISSKYTEADSSRLRSPIEDIYKNVNPIKTRSQLKAEWDNIN